MVKNILNKIKLNLKQLMGNKESKQEAEIIERKIKYNKHGFPSYRPLVEKEKDSNKRNYKY